MKHLLTSAGITNKTIANELFKLVGKKPEETSIVVIPTASNVEIGDKCWYIEDLINLKNLNFKSIEISDISADDESVWLKKISNVDVLFFEGGNTFHLMNWINKTGLDKKLSEILKNKVYMGASAGSMVASKDLLLKTSQKLFEEDLDKSEDMDGLQIVDFYIIPHFNSEYFNNRNEEYIREVTSNLNDKIYVLDDNSAVVVDGDTVEVVSEGKWFEIN